METVIKIAFIFVVGFGNNEVQKSQSQSQSVGHLAPATAGLYFPDSCYSEASVACLENVFWLTYSSKQVVSGYFHH